MANNTSTANLNFEFVNDNGDISIVRHKSASRKKSVQVVQRMKVMCFDSAQIDRIFKIQEQSQKPTTKLFFFSRSRRGEGAERASETPISGGK